MMVQARTPSFDSKTVTAVFERLNLTQIQGAPPDADFDLIAKAPRGREAVIQLKHLGTLRHDDLLGRLALAALTLKRHASKGKIPLVVITTPNLTPKAVVAATEFMDEHGGDVQWVLLGKNGDQVVRAMALGEERELWLVRKGKQRLAVDKTFASQPFSDMNAWMLKVLLMRDVSERLWNGPREKVRSPSHLAEVARVSEPHAYRFVRTFEDMDFLRRSEAGLVVVRRAALLASWFEATRHASRKTLSVRWLLGAPKSPDDVFADKSEGVFARQVVDFLDGFFRLDLERPQVALAGFEACRALGVLHTEPGVAELHALGDAKRILEHFKLEIADERDAHFNLILDRSDAPFRGAIGAPKRVASVDVLQAALDVIVQPARGIEQAEHIIEGVLGWELP